MCPDLSNESNSASPLARRVLPEPDMFTLAQRAREYEKKAREPENETKNADAKELGVVLNHARLNLIGAERNYRMAAEKGHADSQFALGQLYEEGLLGKGNMPVQSVSWLKEHSLLNPEEEFPPDFAKAGFWYEKAALQGHRKAMFQLASLHAAAFEGIHDPVKAAKWYKTAAEAGLADAKTCWGICLARGIGVISDPVDGIGWLKQAADSGSWKARYEIARLIQEGLGVERDPVQAAEYMRIAAEQEYPPAQLAFGKMCLAGEGVEKNRNEGLYWIKKAALEHLHQAAVRELSRLKKE